jgi:hypothetical protein
VDGSVALGRYRLGRRLGVGAFGTVYEAQDERLNRAVAVKRVSLPGGVGADRAEREARAAARLSHPAIVALYEAGAGPDCFDLVSELVRGRTLAQLLADGDVDDALTLDVGCSLAGALEHAHARGVVHRDIKPQNVIVPDEPPAGVAAKLTDFGVASLAGEEPLTRTGDVVGTFAYMAPEQVAAGHVTELADVYGLGVVLYECLSGRNPIRAANPAATARRVGRRLPPLGRWRPDLPEPLRAAIDAAVQPKVARRGGLERLHRALEQARAGLPPDATAEGPPPAGAFPSLPLRARLIGAACAAGAFTGALELLAPGPLPAPLLIAAPVVLLVALLPRLGWGAGLLALAIWLAAVGRAGAGVLVLLAALPPAVAFARRPGPDWTLPVLAPALGLIGLAGAFPALAGQAATPARRATLGGLGAWACAVCEPLTGDRLWLGAARHSGRPATVRDHLGTAIAHALGPALCPGTALAMVLWALAAVSLPLLVRGGSFLADVIGALAWAALLAAGALALEGWPASRLPGGTPRELVAGLAAGALVALALVLVRPLQSRSMAVR